MHGVVLEGRVHAGLMALEPELNRRRAEHRHERLLLEGTKRRGAHVSASRYATLTSDIGLRGCSWPVEPSPRARPSVKASDCTWQVAHEFEGALEHVAAGRANLEAVGRDGHDTTLERVHRLAAMLAARHHPGPCNGFDAASWACAPVEKRSATRSAMDTSGPIGRGVSL